MASSQIMRPTSNKKRRCQVAFSYSAQNEDELDLEVGEIIYGLREVEDGWWEGHKKTADDGSAGKLGVFPSNFVKVIAESDGEDEAEEAAKTSSENRVKKMGKMGFGPLVTTDALANFRNKKDAGGGGGGGGGAAALETKPPIPKSPVPSPKPVRAASKKAKERLARVLFDYDAVHEDELTIREGDWIVVLDTQLEDPGWWRGCVKGREAKTGVFPDNFVDLVEGAEDAEVMIPPAELVEPPKTQPSVSPKPPRPNRPASPTGISVGGVGGAPSSKNSTLEREKANPSSSSSTVDPSAPQRPDKPSHLLDKASKKLGDIFGPRTSVKRPPPPPGQTGVVITMNEEKANNAPASQPASGKPGKPGSNSGAFGSFKRKPRSATPPSPLSCSGGSSETLDDSTESLDRSGEGPLERTGSGRQSGGGRSSTSGCSSGGAISPTTGAPALTLDDIPATEILPSLTAKRAMKKKGVRPPSGLFITEMGRQAADAGRPDAGRPDAGRPGGITPTSSTTNPIGRTKSAENVVESASKEESRSGDSTPDSLDAPPDNRKTVSPTRPKPPPGAVSLFPFGNPQLPTKKAFQETPSSSGGGGGGSGGGGNISSAALPPQVKPEKKPRPPSLISSRIKNMQDSLNPNSSSSSSTPTPAPDSSALNAHSRQPSSLGNNNINNNNTARNNGAVPPPSQQQQQHQPQHQQPPLHGLRPTRPLPPKQPSPTTEISSSSSPSAATFGAAAAAVELPRATSTPADEDVPASGGSGVGGGGVSHVTIEDGVVTSSSTDDAADVGVIDEMEKDAVTPSSFQQQQQQQQQQQLHHQHQLPPKKVVNGFVKDSSSSSSSSRRKMAPDWADDSLLTTVSSLEDLKKVVATMKAEMVSREDHDKVVDELRATKQQVQLLTEKIERLMMRLGN